MLTKLRGRNGQSTLEYVILVVIVIAALLSIQLYLKRGIMGRARTAADDIGDQWETASSCSVKVTKDNSKQKDLTLPTGSSTNFLGGSVTTYENIRTNVNAQYGFKDMP